MPESVTTTLASSGEFEVSAVTVWNVYEVYVADEPVMRSLYVMADGVIEFDTRMLYVYVLMQLPSETVRVTYCPTSTMAFDGDR